MQTPQPLWLVGLSSFRCHTSGSHYPDTPKGKNMSNAAFMCKNRHGMYYARFVIPKHLQSHFNNKKEIRRSLQTDSRKLAIRRARVYRVQFESIVDELMSKLEKGNYSAFEVTLKGDRAIIINGEEKPITGEIKRNLSSLDELPAHKEYLANQIRAEALHQAQLAAIASAAQTPAPAQPINPKKLSEYLVDYIKYQIDPNRKKGKGWGVNTRVNKTKTLERFIEFCDKPAAAFGWDEAQRFIQIAQSIPTNFKNGDHSKKFAGLTIEMLLDDSIDTSAYQPRKPSAIFIDIGTVRAFIEWVRSNQRVKGLQDAVDAFDLELKEIDITSTRRAFTPTELRTLFDDDNPAAENYVKGFNSKRVNSANLKYWLPLLGLYTGAALSELCQLHLSDIYSHKAFDGSEHWVIDFNEDNAGKRLKNPFRARLVPVHKVLLGLGLINYVQELSDKGEKELFPDSQRCKGLSFSTEGQWWGEYSDNAGVTDKDVVFHSFKHTLDTCLFNNHATDPIINAFSGHTRKTTAGKYYRTGGHRDADIGPLVEWINKIDYGLKHHPFKLTR